MVARVERSDTRVSAPWVSLRSTQATCCDGGERYAGSYYDDSWLSAQGFDLAPSIAAIAACAERGEPLPGDLPTAGL